jgi:hypothetical protein
MADEFSHDPGCLHSGPVLENTISLVEVYKSKDHLYAEKIRMCLVCCSFNGISTAPNATQFERTKHQMQVILPTAFFPSLLL